MTSAQVVETSVTVTDNSPFQDYPHPDDHTTRTTVIINKFLLLSPAGLWYCVNLVCTSLNRFLSRSISRGVRIWTPCRSSSSIFLNTISYFACCSSISSGFKRIRNEIKLIPYVFLRKPIYNKVKLNSSRLVATVNYHLKAVIQ